jgi:phospholipase/lecithinase/hemolysin
MACLRALGLSAALLAVSGCAWLFHKPRPDIDLPLADRPWRVRCRWVLAATTPAAAPEAGWVWAADAEGRRLVVTGGLEDGFLRGDDVRAASDEDDRDVVPVEASARAVAEACATSASRTRAGAEVYAIAAAREGEGVEVALALAGGPAPRPTSRVVVFGDSLSDPGNLKQRLVVFPLSPYWLGRFANGPIWPEHLARRTGIAVQNHAFGGAVSAPHEDVPAADIVSAIQQGAQHFLTGSVQRYVADYVERDLPAGFVQRPRETAFVVWAGANDYISKEPFTGDIGTLLDTPQGEAGSDRVIDLSTQALADQVRRLYAAGARRFVVVNLPDLGRTPAVLHNTSYQPGGDRSDEARRIRLGRRLSELTARHNQRLKRALDRAGREMVGETIVLVDTEKAVELMLAGRAPDGSRGRFDYGFALAPLERTLRDGRRMLRVQERCYSGGYLGTSDPERICPEADRAFFWDAVHPAELTHCWIAWFVEQELFDAGLLDRASSAEEHRAYCLESPQARTDESSRSAR